MMSLWEFLTADGSPSERAGIDAHQATATVSASVLKDLRRARRLRWMPLAWFSPWRRQYLDIFIEKLEQELNRREMKRRSPSKSHSHSRRRSGSEASAEAGDEAPGDCGGESASRPKVAGTGGQAIATQFDKGLRRAKEVARKQPDKAAYWLRRAMASRRRWTTRLFNPRKRRFLDGFIAGLNVHLAAQPASSDSCRET